MAAALREEEDERPCAARLLLASVVWSLLEKPIAALDLVNPMQAPLDKQILRTNMHILSSLSLSKPHQPSAQVSVSWDWEV